jgi:hypothetical protein
MSFKMGAPEGGDGASKKKHKSLLKNVTHYTGRPMDTTVMIVATVLAVTAAWAWRDALEVAFETYYKDENRLRARVIYAIIMIFAAVIGIYFISRIRAPIKNQGMVGPVVIASVSAQE